jgi:Icc-related predicted phosphoesterase
MAAYPCLLVSDLHGRSERYAKLLAELRERPPYAVFMAGDLLPFEDRIAGGDFLTGFMIPEFERLRHDLGERAPRVLLVLGNDDPRDREEAILEAAARGTWEYLHERSVTADRFELFGYGCVPPTPFLLKDWERYDVSRYVDPGCVPPEQGRFTVSASRHEVGARTIASDLERLAGGKDMAGAVFLFHSPPYRTRLDRAALDGQSVDHVPLDVHVGSVAIRRFIERREPLLTLHGHIHESARISGSWKDRIGRTQMFSAAHDGPQLALVRFDLGDPDDATRELL